jgi:steroid delta-isomerase-like uncharacterized protein
MSQSPEAVMREWFDQLWNQKKIETIDRLFAADGIAHGLSGDVMKGPAGFRPFYAAFAEAFPDLHIKVLRAIVQGEFVVVHNHVTGTHGGHTLGFAATGRNATFEGVTIARIVDGKIVEGWNFYDFLSMYQQLGVTPPVLGA